MLAGEPPFTGPTAQAVIARRLSQPAPSLRDIRPSVPQHVDAALRRALAPIPADRFASTDEFARALSAASTGVSARTRVRWPIAAGGAALLLAGFIAVWLVVSQPNAQSDASDADQSAIRLAVLPFRLIGGDSADRYLAEGISEEVTSTLANLSGLRVIDRSSVTQFGSGTKSAREIGASLGVDALVDGDVQKAGDAIRVRVKLIEPSTEESRWSQTYDLATRDVFRVQSEVATKVAGVLRIQLAERESRSLARPPTMNPEAYDAYLRAIARRRGEGTRAHRAMTDSNSADLTSAVRLDSTFGMAWAHLATELISAVFLFNAEPAQLDRADRAISNA
ncbi:MAG: hypothetical protein ACRETX_13925, partial [Steroidobacteraceae bacterium]